MDYFSFAQEFLQLGADVISSEEPLLNVDDLADQVAEVLDFFGYVTFFSEKREFLSLHSGPLERIPMLFLDEEICDS